MFGPPTHKTAKRHSFPSQSNRSELVHFELVQKFALVAEVRHSTGFDGWLFFLSLTVFDFPKVQLIRVNLSLDYVKFVLLTILRTAYVKNGELSQLS